MLSSLFAKSQEVTLVISGQLTQTPSNQPYPFHKVMVTINPDSANPSPTIIDSALTNVAGTYSMFLPVPWVPGTSVSFVVSTIDCQDFLHEQAFVYTGNSPQYSVNFAICGDSIPPSQCDSYFDVAGSTGLSVSLWGHMVVPQTASYSWDFGDGTTGNGEYITHSFPSQGTYSVALTTVTNDSCMDFSVQTVTVYDTTPPVNCENYISIISTSGLSVTMYGSLNYPQNATYLWDFGDGTDTTGVLVTHTYQASGTFPITLTSTTVNGCTDVTTTNITVIDSVTNDCSSYFTASATNIPYQIQFFGFTNSVYPTSFLYFFNDPGSGLINNSNLQNPLFTFSGSGTYFVTLTTTDSTGCTFEYVAPVFIPSQDCDNQIEITSIQGYTVTLEGSMVNGMPATYTWDLGDGITTTGSSSVTHTYSVLGTYIVSLTTNSDSCMDWSSVMVTVPDTFPTGCNSYFTSFPGNAPNEFQFVGYTNSPFPTQFLYNFGDPLSGVNNSSTSQNPSHIFSAVGTYLVTLTTTDSTGCSFAFTAPVEILPQNCDNEITINSVQNLTVTLQGSLLNGSSAIYYWDLGDGSTSTGNTVSHTYPATGVYTISLTTTTNNGCEDVSTAIITLVDSIPIGCSCFFNAIVEVNLYEIQFNGIATGVGPITYSWNFGDPLSGAANTSALQDPYHIFSNPGTYTVSLSTIDSNNCSSTFSSSITLGFFGTHTLLGQIKAGNQIITACKVQLFSQDENGNMNLVQEVNPDSANYYNFTNVVSGIYRILAIPLAGTAYAQQYLPTYFGNSYLWESATPIVLGQPANSYNINLVPFDSISGGAGQINGSLTTGGKSMNVGNQEILILDNTNTPVKCLFTLPDGTFSFAGLPYGEYKVYPVITGITTHPVTVVLSETNKTATVIMKISGQSVSGFGKNQQEGIIANVFPNPASEEIFVTVKSKGSVQLMIVDATGKTIIEKQETILDDSRLIALTVSGLKQGIYLLVVQDENGNTASQRFIKK